MHALTYTGSLAASTLILSASDSYTAGTDIQKGTVQLSGGADRLPMVGSVTLGDAANDSGVLDLNGQAQTVAALTTTGTGATNEVIDSTGGGSLTVNDAGPDTFGGFLGNGAANIDFALTKSGAGTLTLTNTANAYTGATTITGGMLSIGADGDLGTAPGAETAADLVLNNGTLQATGTFSLNPNRGIALGPTSNAGGTGTIDVTGNNTLTYDGIIADNGTGPGALVKTDTGTLLLDVDSAATYSGTTSINGGTVELDGSLASDVSVNNGGTLTGLGGTTGTVTVNTGGTINPGTVGTIGSLSVGALTLNGGTYQADISGNFSDSIVSSGTVNLDNGTAGTFALGTVSGVTSAGKNYTLIQNNSGSAISKTPLTGATEGGTTTVNGKTAYFSYLGGPGAENFTLTAAGPLSVRSDGQLKLERVVSGGSDNLEVLQGGNIIASEPTASVTSVMIQSDAANTTLTVAYNTADDYLQIPITFAGHLANNALVIQDPVSGFGNTTYTYTTAAAGSGSVDLYSDVAGTQLLNTIAFTGLSPLTNIGTVANVVFNLPAGVTDATLQNVDAHDEKLSSATPAFEATTFTDPTGSLTVNGTGALADDLTVASLANPFSASLTLNLSSSPSGEIDFTGPVTLSSGDSITATAATITDVGAALRDVRRRQHHVQCCHQSDGLRGPERRHWQRLAVHHLGQHRPDGRGHHHRRPAGHVFDDRNRPEHRHQRRHQLQCRQHRRRRRQAGGFDGHAVCHGDQRYDRWRAS